VRSELPCALLLLCRANPEGLDISLEPKFEGLLKWCL
jgi:hypothetical protein